MVSRPRKFPAALLVVVSAGLGASVVSGSADAAGAREFKNCTEMHKVYKGGVAHPGASDRRANGGKAKYRPKVSRALCNANSKSDRDRDGVACEQ